jgi:hypothetical protein
MPAVPKRTREKDTVLKELIELAKHGLNDLGYEFPFNALIVGANCYVLALEFVKEGVAPNILYEKGEAYFYPLNFFFHCEGKEPFSAKIVNPSKEAVCVV